MILWIGIAILALNVSLAAPANHAARPPVPNGHDLFELPIVAFRAYVGGVYDGQAVLSGALGIQPIICLDTQMTRNDLASLVLYALPKLSTEVMDLPANEVVFRVLVENVRCPGVTWRPRE